jgi:protein translocase SecG subunit
MWGDISMVGTIITVLFVIVALLMTFLILLQEGKGGGLASLGGTKAAGVEGVTNPIRRATGWLAGIFFVLAILLGALNKPKKQEFVGEQAKAAEKKDEKKDETKAPGMGAMTPAEPKKPDATAVEKPAETKTGDAKPAETKTEEPKKAEEPKTDPAKTDAPKTEAPKTEEPKAEAPKADAPKTEEPKKEETK